MNKSYFLIQFLALLSISARSQTWTTIDVQTPGTLESAILGKTAAQLANTRINGALNWQDLKLWPEVTRASTPYRASTCVG